MKVAEEEEAAETLLKKKEIEKLLDLKAKRQEESLEKLSEADIDARLKELSGK